MMEFFKKTWLYFLTFFTGVGGEAYTGFAAKVVDVIKVVIA